ncbi:CHAT domain-containing protein [Streptomyces sp. 3MP-14]|uniref:CHAT domain-containing protein n=1 Tax=Streptomyces mimosae TaxID=2586635 RepID=A0A5N6AAR6_9ACTN|nr:MULTISPECIES: CHAT domain-containing protein [Streptomyces]KAB8165731.1 CHAT domain-containing protein [Streptomyces mimosae]KAB8176120.1 CHAT domain-containing protein [Streptomyces sp. 3MP-14]
MVDGDQRAARRDALTERLALRLERFRAAGGPSMLLDGSDVLAEARELTALLGDGPEDVPARLALGWFHWHRAELLPEHRMRAELDAAEAALTSCFAFGAPDEALPAPLLPRLARGAASMALGAVVEAGRTGDARLAAHAVELFERIVARLPDQPVQWGWLGIARGVRFRLTGEPGELVAAVHAAHRAATMAPPGHAEHDELAGGLRELLRLAFATGAADPAGLVDAARHAVAITPAEDPALPELLGGLSEALGVRARQSAGAPGAADLDAAVDAARRAVALAPAEHPERPALLRALVGTLAQRHDRWGRDADLDALIEAVRASLALEPAGGPVRPAILRTLSGWLRQRFERAGDAADLDEAVAALSEAAQATPADDPGLVAVLHALSMARWERFEHAGAPADRDAAIDAGRRALSRAPDGEPAVPALSFNLSMALRSRFEAAGDPADLDEAVAAGHRAVAEAPPGSADLPLMLHNVSLARLTRFELRGDPPDLDAAVAAGRRAIAATPAEAPPPASLLTSLSIALRSRATWGGDPADLDAALAAAREAVAASEPDDPDRARQLAALAQALLGRYQRHEEPADLAETVEAARAAVAATPAGDGRAASRLHTLSTALGERYDLRGERADLDEGIDRLRAAVSLLREGDDTLPRCLTALAVGLRKRFQHAGDPADLDAAIATGQRAVRAARPNDPLLPRALHALGNALSTRAQHAGDRTDLDAAVDAVRRALAALPADHPERAGLGRDLGLLLQARFTHAGEPADLDEAIALGRDVPSAPTAGTERASRLDALNTALTRRFTLAGRAADLDEAIEAGRRAVAAAPAGGTLRPVCLNNLSLALLARLEHGGTPADADAAVEAAREAAADERTGGHISRHNLGMALVARFVARQDPGDLAEATSLLVAAAGATTSAPSARVLSARAAALLTADEQPALAARLLADAVGLLPEVAPRALRRDDQQRALGDVAGLATDAAALALADPSTPPGDRPVRALRLLEAGRGVLLSQALETRDDLSDLRAQHPRLVARFEALRALLDRQEAAPGERDTAPAVGQRRGLAEEFAAVIAEIRALPGQEGFARPPTLDQLRAEAASGPVVTVNVSRHRSDALLLTGAGVTAVPLPGLDPETLEGAATTFHRALNPPGGRADEAALTEVLGWLWDTVAEPVLTALGLHGPPPEGADWPRLWWVPTGRLATLPLHAAGHHRAGDGRTVLDRVISSSTPTVGALRHARRRATGRGPALGDRSLLVAMEATPGAAPLAGVAAEAALVAARLPRPEVLQRPAGDGGLAATLAPTLAPAGPATRAAVEERLPGRAFAHFACHAWSDPRDPARSLLLLEDHRERPFSVARVAALNLDRARLAYLSACQTALTSASALLDEAIQLVSAFQLAGFPQVVGTLWPIDDRIAVEIADAFYRGLAAPGGGPEPTLDAGRAAEALHHAVRAGRASRPRFPSVWAAHLHAGA